MAAILIRWPDRKDAGSISRMESERGQLELGSEAFAGLIEEFRRGHIAGRRREKAALDQHLAELSRRWDLDRYLRLVENRYKVWYKGELFVARRTADGA